MMHLENYDIDWHQKFKLWVPGLICVRLVNILEMVYIIMLAKKKKLKNYLKDLNKAPNRSDQIGFGKNLIWSEIWSGLIWSDLIRNLIWLIWSDLIRNPIWLTWNLITNNINTVYHSLESSKILSEKGKV